MKKGILTLLLFFFTSFLFSQENLGNYADIVPLEVLPKIFQDKIKHKIPRLLKRDSLKGNFKESEDYMKHTYSYDIRLQDSLIIGEYNRITECDNCDLEKNNYTFNFKLTVLYCCRDKKHKPNETAKTVEKIKTIQRLNGCKKIGICNYD